MEILQGGWQARVGTFHGVPNRMPTVAHVRREGLLLRCGFCPRFVGRLSTDDMAWVYAKLDSPRCAGCGLRLEVNEDILEAETVASYG